MTSPDSAAAQHLVARQSTVLRQTFPGWRIRSRAGMWCAIRNIAPTQGQTEAGLHRYIVQPSAEALAAVLTHQLGIAQRIRSRRP